MKPEVITIKKWELSFVSVSIKKKLPLDTLYLIKSKELPLSFVKHKENKDCHRNLDWNF